MFSTDTRKQPQRKKKTLPIFDFFTLVEWRTGERGKAALRFRQLVLYLSPVGPPQKRQHTESSVLSFSSLKQLFGREKQTYRPIHIFSARSWIFLSYKE